MTPFIKKKDIKNNWYLVNGENLVVGRLAAYLSKVLRGKDKPETDGREGLRSLELLVAAYKSAQDGQLISLPFPLPCGPWGYFLPFQESPLNTWSELMSLPLPSSVENHQLKNAENFKWQPPLREASLKLLEKFCGNDAGPAHSGQR